MTDVAQIVAGPRLDERHNRELPEHQWVTCHGCPAFRVNDFHYFYCRRLGDQGKADAWSSFGGWARIGHTVWNEEQPAPCGLPVRTALLSKEGESADA